MKPKPRPHTAPSHACVPELPPGEALPINVIARALGLHRYHILDLIDEGDLVAFDLRSPGACRACIRISRASVISFLEKRQATGKRASKRPRISPTRTRAHPRPTDALLAILRQ